MSWHARLGWYGSAGLLVVIGVVCAVVVGGGTGQILALVLISVGCVEFTALIFYEVGLSEDRERAREARAASSRDRPRPSEPERPHFQRSRSHRRHLR